MTTIANANGSALGNNHFTSEHTFVNLTEALWTWASSSYEENDENKNDNSANQ
jgi:hypothetical protein